MPNQIYIANYHGLMVAFSSQAPYYEEADLWHYLGTAILPAMQTQIVTTAPDPSQAIVNNSLPVWLGLNSYIPPYPGFVMPPGLMLYPSFAVPDNLVPPYGVVHIDEDTEALSTAPYYDSSLSSYRLAKDRVRVTLYGTNNAIAQSFLDFVLQYSRDTSIVGMLNTPILRDAKRSQAELAIIAQKKVIDFEVSYQQFTARAVARQLIETVVVQYLAQPITVAV
jgi:hypothetical protein